MATSPRWGVQHLRRECKRLRELIARDPALAAELTAYWPGGQENKEDGRGKWIYCYANYLAMWRAFTPGKTHSDEAEHIRTLAIAETPEHVVLTDGSQVAVHPLSAHALEFLSTIDRSVLRVVELQTKLAMRTDEPAERVVALAPMVRSYAVRLWAWILTSGEAALPFQEQEAEVEPPEWTKTLAPDDLLILHAAHQRVNGHRNVVLGTLFPDTGNSSTPRMSLAGFIGAYAQEKGGDSGVLWRKFSLGKVFAQAASAAEHYEATKPQPAPAGVA